MADELALDQVSENQAMQHEAMQHEDAPDGVVTTNARDGSPLSADLLRKGYQARGMEGRGVEARLCGQVFDLGNVA